MAAMAIELDQWLTVTPHGLYCVPADLWIDPSAAKPRALITHGHADHARAGHGAVLATADTIAIMQARYGEGSAQSFQPLAYGETIAMGGVAVKLVPAGHVLGSAQAVMTYQGHKVVISGDYKRRADPTCAGFAVERCHSFITEATFGLPVFKHPSTKSQIAKLLSAQIRAPERTLLLGCYALGKAQRLIAELRRAGYKRPLYLHGAMKKLCALYERQGVALGPLEDATVDKKTSFAGEIVLAPPSAMQDRWARRLNDPIVAMASGWMSVRQRAKQRLVELPMIVSDHADWTELTQTVKDTGCEQLWVTHGREEALVHWAQTQGLDAKALSLLGREEEAE